MKIKSLLAALLLSSLSACQSPSLQSPLHTPLRAPLQSLAQQRVPVHAQQQSRALFPEEQGTKWDYAVTLAPTMDPLAEEKGSYSLLLEKVKSTPQGKRLELRAQSGFNGYYSFPTLIQGPQGIQLEDMTFLGIGSEAVRGLKIDFLKLPFQAQQRWEDEYWIGSYKGRETVRVPAGEFEAERVSVIGTFQNAYTAVGDYWIAPGVGVVKSDINIPGFSVLSELRHFQRP